MSSPPAKPTQYAIYRISIQELGIELEWCDTEENEKGIVKSIHTSGLNQSFNHSIIQSLNHSIIQSNKITVDDHSTIRPSNHSSIHPFVPSVRIGDCVVEVSPAYYRPTEVELLIGNPEKAQRKLGWKAKTGFEELVGLMIKGDYETMKKKLKN